MQGCIGRNVAAHTVEDTIQGKLADSNNRGVVLELTFSDQGSAPFEGITQEREVLILIPWFRLKGLSTVSFKGLK